MIKIKRTKPNHKKREPSCGWQVACSDWPKDWACMESSAEGHVFKCSRSPAEVTRCEYYRKPKVEPK